MGEESERLQSRRSARTSMKLITLILVVALVNRALAVSDQEWNDFKVKYGKTYKTLAGEAKARANYDNSQKLISEHNARQAAGTESYILGNNELSDISTANMRRTKLGLEINLNARTLGTPIDIYSLPAVRDAPASIDFSTDPCMTPVKNQKICSSSYAFSTVAAVEFYSCKKSGFTGRNFSEQQFVDCSSNYGNHECTGGHFLNCYDYLVDGARGIANGRQYPYVAKPNQKCLYNNQTMRRGIISEYKYLLPPVNDSLWVSLVSSQSGPINIAMDASRPTFRLYMSGIYDDTSCTIRVNHAALLVGYGTDNGADFWKIKNSWGTSWGEEGYFRIARGVNRCGIASSYMAIPVV